MTDRKRSSTFREAGRTLILLLLISLGLSLIALLSGQAMEVWFGFDKGVQSVVGAFVVCQGIFIATWRYGNNYTRKE